MSSAWPLRSVSSLRRRYRLAYDQPGVNEIHPRLIYRDAGTITCSAARQAAMRRGSANGLTLGACSPRYAVEHALPGAQAAEEVTASL